MVHARRANLRGSFLHNDRLPEACRQCRAGRSGPAVWWNGIGGMGRGARSRRSRAFFPSPHARVAATFSDRSGRARGVAGPQVRSLIKCALPPLPPPQLAWPAPSSGRHQARNCDTAIPRASTRAIRLDLLPLEAATNSRTVAGIWRRRLAADRARGGACCTGRSLAAPEACCTGVSWISTGCKHGLTKGSASLLRCPLPEQPCCTGGHHLGRWRRATRTRRRASSWLGPTTRSLRPSAADWSTLGALCGSRTRSRWTGWRRAGRGCNSSRRGCRTRWPPMCF
jgi:hypothetical protein